MNLPPGLRDLIAEVRRRRVATVAAIYIGVAWLLLQIADLVVPNLLLPEWTNRLVLFLLILGLPVALVLAWAFEMTPEGVRRTEPAPGAPEDSADRQGTASAGWHRLVGAAIVVLLAAAWWFGLGGLPGHGSGGTSAATANDVSDVRPISIAVLPFENMSTDEDQEIFSEGFSDDILNLLTQVPQLLVIARTSSFAFKDAPLTAEQLGDTLHARYLVEGSVREDRGKVRIGVQLIDTETGGQTWSQSWDRALEGVFEVQDEIAAMVADQLKLSLLGDAPKVEPTDTEAYLLALRARHMAHELTIEGVLGAVDLYKRALTLDPSYAEGWAGLASAYAFSGLYQAAKPESDAAALARDAAERALAIDSTQGIAHEVLGQIANESSQLVEAGRQYQEALALAPGTPEVLIAVSYFLATIGRPEDAVRLAGYAVDRDPVDWLSYFNLGAVFLHAGRPQDALGPLKTARDLNPEANGPHYLLGEALLRLDQPRAALKTIQSEPEAGYRLTVEAKAYEALDQEEASRGALAALIDGYALSAAPLIASVLASRGEADRAFRWLDRAAERQNAALTDLQSESEEFALLHDDPRWPAFLERIGRSPEQLAAIGLEVTLPRLETIGE